jgi:hypothetical protein
MKQVLIGVNSIRGMLSADFRSLPTTFSLRGVIVTAAFGFLQGRRERLFGIILIGLRRA